MDKSKIVAEVRKARSVVRELTYIQELDQYPAASKLIKEAYDKISRAHEAIASGREPE